jgi:acetylornithine deacetylase
MNALLDIVPEARLVEIAQRIVRTPSEQSALFETDPAVQSFIRGCVAPLLAEFGLIGRFDKMGNLIVESGPTDARASSMLLTYSMTHPAASMADPFAGQLLEEASGPVLRGRGVAEQKGALAAAIAAFVAAATLDPASRRVLAISTAGETGQHKAAESILATLDHLPALCIVAIGTGSRVSIANKGRLDVHIDIRGRSSHSSTPWAGLDAIAGARVVMECLEQLDLGSNRHALLGRATLTPTAIRSFPEATHTIQDHVRLTYDRRLLPGDDPDAALAQIQAAVGDIAPWHVEANAGALQYPAELPEDGAFMHSLRAGCVRMGLPVPQTFASHGCVDAGLLSRLGSEAAMWGPGEQSMWHTADERLPVQDLANAAAGYLGVLLAFTDKDRP